jgi:hypothetical protein
MAISVILITQVTDSLGFTKWTWIPLLHRDVVDSLISVSYSEIPDNLVPASEFQIAAETSTCTLIAPWGGFDDAFTEFFQGGGTSGTVLGALNGLSIVEQSFLQKGTANYGLGQEYLGPQMGYCIGTLFKEKVYTEVNALNFVNLNPLISGPSVNADDFDFDDAANQTGSSREQLIWRSRFERFYLNHGLIRDFQDIDRPNGKFRVLIDTKCETSAVGTIDFSAVPDAIRLNKRSDGVSVTFSIDEVRGSDGIIEIDVTYAGPDAPIQFRGSDYFRLSESWLIQDPYLLDGLMNRISTGTLPSGNQEFFRTDQNASISEGSVIGVYIRRRNIAVGDNVVVNGQNGVVIGANEEKRAEEEAEAGASTAADADADAEEEVTDTDVTEDTVTQRIVQFVDVEFEDGQIEIDIPVEDVFLLSAVDDPESTPSAPVDPESTPSSPVDPEGPKDFVSTTVAEDVGSGTIEDPVSQPNGDFQTDFELYFSPGAEGVVLTSTTEDP